MYSLGLYLVFMLLYASRKYLLIYGFPKYLYENEQIA